MFKKKFISIVFMFFVPVLLFSQESSYIHEWGEISEDELQMKGIEEDPEANAVILFNVGEIKIFVSSEDSYMEMKVHKRMKILTEAGKDLASVEISYYYEDEIDDLEAISYSPDGTEHELDNDNIFEEQTKYRKKKVFAIPGVEVGSVIEFRYELFSKYIGGLEPWQFQENDFTIYSKIDAYFPPGFTFSGLSMNFEYYDIVNTHEVVRDPYDFSKKCNKHTWTATNIPGIKEEPYMTAFDDYYAKILFQLISFKNEYVFRKYAETWDDVAKRVWQEYGNLVDQDGGLEDFTNNLIIGLTKPVDKVQKIYEYVCSQIKTTDHTGLGGDDLKEPEDVFNRNEGSVVEKNLLLINMLHHAGFNAKPLIMSKRSNGRINTDWAQLQQFNRVLAYLELDEKKWFLNTESKYCPMGYLIPEYDVEYGLLINEDKGSIIPIIPLTPKNKLEIETKSTLEENGDLSLISKLTYDGMTGVLERDLLEKKDIKEYLEKKIKDLHGEAVLDSFHYANIDSINLPLLLELTYHIPGYLEDTGDMAYFSPPLLTGLKENPFVREKRNFPVDYSYDYTNNEIAVIHIPSSYKISEEPNRIKDSIKSFSFNKIYFASENKIECRRTFNLGRKQFFQSEYPKLRSIYEKIVNSDQDQIVLVKK